MLFFFNLHTFGWGLIRFLALYVGKMATKSKIGSFLLDTAGFKKKF
jgi:hypothetical protein